MDSQVSYPNNENRNVDRENPYHKDEDRMGVVVEVVVRVERLERVSTISVDMSEMTNRISGQLIATNAC